MNLKKLSQIFNKPLSWCYGRQVIYIRDQIEFIKNRLDTIIELAYSCDESEQWFIQDQIEELNEKLNRLEKRKYFLNKLIKFNRDKEQGKPVKEEMISYDIETIKRVSIDRLVKVTSAGFFINNPFRNERSPSNSLYWNKKNNTWRDFGSGEYGDVIDLYMKLNGCDFKEALRDLSLM
jgi:hypothetical protein